MATGCPRTELRAAMRPASQNPQEERSPDDLGRFGWGMKSASFSQCTRLTVISTKDGQTSGALCGTSTRWTTGEWACCRIRKSPTLHQNPTKGRAGQKSSGTAVTASPKTAR